MPPVPPRVSKAVKEPADRAVPGLLVLLVLLLASPASADVVILVGSDAPLIGTIVQETETTIRFRIQGLAAGSFVEIERSRIKRLWRDGERDAPLRDAPSPSSAPSSSPSATRAARDATWDRRPEPRSPEELRDGYVERLRARIRSLVPGSAPTASLTVFLALLFGTLLLWVGGRLANTEELGLPQCAVLSLLTLLLLIVDLYMAPTLVGSPALVVAISAEVVFWLLFVRLLLHESLDRAVVLLAFLVLATGLIALVGVCVLSVF